MDVLKQNDKFIVLDDEYFTKLQKKKEKHGIYSVPERVSIREEEPGVCRDIFGRFSISTYSTSSQKVIENRINREFKKWIKAKLDAYGGTIPEIKIEVKEKKKW
jgi:hypothetical protein